MALFFGVTIAYKNVLFWRDCIILCWSKTTKQVQQPEEERLLTNYNKETVLRWHMLFEAFAQRSKVRDHVRKYIEGTLKSRYVRHFANNLYHKKYTGKEKFGRYAKNRCIQRTSSYARRGDCFRLNDTRWRVLGMGVQATGRAQCRLKKAVDGASARTY